jgi:hypothetical protein
MLSSCYLQRKNLQVTLQRFYFPNTDYYRVYPDCIAFVKAKRLLYGLKLRSL